MSYRPDLNLIDDIWDQYIPILEYAGYKPDTVVYLMGFSNSGMFAHRFAMIHPERVKAIWVGGEAPAPLPANEMEGTTLNYPLGIANIENLFGEPFDFEAYKRIPHFICVGENDTVRINDTVNPEIFSDEQTAFIKNHFGSTNPDRIRFFYEYLDSVGVSAEFKLYKGIGHEIPSYMLDEAFNFLTKN